MKKGHDESKICQIQQTIVTRVKPATTMLSCSNALSFKILLTSKPTMYFRYLQYSLVNLIFDDQMSE